MLCIVRLIVAPVYSSTAHLPPAVSSQVLCWSGSGDVPSAILSLLVPRVECCVCHSDTNNWCYQPSTGDIQQHFHFFLRHFKVHFNFVKVAGPMTIQLV